VLVRQKQFEGVVRYFVFDRDGRTPNGRARAIIVRNDEIDLVLAATFLLISALFFPSCVVRPFRSNVRHDALHAAGWQLVVRRRANDTILLLSNFGVAFSRGRGGVVVGLLLV
jgi:hypothetical protein